MTTQELAFEPKAQLDLDAIRARAFDMRWLAADGGEPMTDEPAVLRGSDRDVLAHLIGVDAPDLVNEVLRLRAGFAAYQDAVTQRAPSGGIR
ncbi:hypothetical protein [Nonomuraea zeae]|uniref:Uncharacterized protein n=1 Tax=Nonomuraea zeae TaxID=1642303 RepID=A0A5S4H3B6_9ACTN|nr:hypothetical protein [Nonomuraea zeae]TMR39627.1 hypothetical protein ETD85_01030 [Nonomuraea zeae]